MTDTKSSEGVRAWCISTLKNFTNKLETYTYDCISSYKRQPDSCQVIIFTDAALEQRLKDERLKVVEAVKKYAIENNINGLWNYADSLLDESNTNSSKISTSLVDDESKATEGKAVKMTLEVLDAASIVSLLAQPTLEPKATATKEGV